VVTIGRQTEPVSRDRPTFHFVGGKGGVGKTTCSAALGIAASASGERVLVASTDPAPSLGDAFDVPLSSRPRRITASRRQLFAVELDAAASFRRWIAARQPLLESIAVNGTWLDDDDVARLIRLSLPGIDELAALFEIAVLARSNRFDHVVVDTAPTGHTLRMLALPATLAGVARVFDAMRDRRREVESALRGRWVEGPEDLLIRELAATAAELHALLRDPHRTRITWVTLPEALSVSEAMDATAALAAAGLTVGGWIVNRRTPRRRGRCAHCDARAALEARAVKRLPRHRPLLQATAHDDEPRGVAALRAIAAELGASRRPEGTLRAAPRWRATLAGPSADAAALVEPPTRLVMVAGKGGVGKSTCAAGLALASAERWPERNVLLVSTDPAHSLADVFGVDGGNRLRTAPNLDVKELDAAAAYATIRAGYATAIDSLFERVAGRSGLDAGHDREVMKQLLDLAPPGLDELAAILDIADTLSAAPAARHLIVMDTAPTGHALRLLEMPALVHDWVRTLMSILLKYEGIAGLGSLGALLLDLSRRIGHLRTLIADPDRTRVVAVTRAAALPRLETVRLLRRLRRLHVSTPFLVVNAVGRGTCASCRRQSAADTRELALLRAALGPPRRAPGLLLAPVHLPPPSGLAALRRWTREWRHDQAAPEPVRYHRSR
jgi:arsenite-transporting ATPase